MGALREDLCTFITVARSIVSESRAVYEIMWKHMVEADRQQMTI
jgi:hypothetical protein